MLACYPFCIELRAESSEGKPRAAPGGQPRFVRSSQMPPTCTMPPVSTGFCCVSPQSISTAQSRGKS